MEDMGIINDQLSSWWKTDLCCGSVFSSGELRSVGSVCRYDQSFSWPDELGRLKNFYVADGGEPRTIVS